MSAILKKILNSVCLKYNVNPTDLVSFSRKKELVEPRQIFCYLSTIMTKISKEEIGSFIKRDRATVIHSCNKIKDEILIYRTLKNDVELLINEIQFSNIVVSNVNLLQNSINYTNSFINV